MKLSLKLSLELSQNNINKTVSGTFSGTGCRPPCAGLHKKSRPDGPSRRRSPTGKPSPLPPPCWNTPGRSREKLVVPSVSAPAQKRWNHHPWSLAMDSGLGSASGGASTSIGSSSRRSNGAEGTTPLRASSPPPVVVTAPGRRHRHHLNPRGLGRSPGIPSVYPPSG